MYAVKDNKETLDFYEVLLVTTEKKEIEIQILADGKIKAEEEKKSEKKDEKKDEKKGNKEDDNDKNEKGNKGSELPKAIAEALKSKFPGSKVVGASKEGKGEKAVYEVELRYKTTTLEVLLTSKGEVVEVEVKGKNKEEDEEKGERKFEKGDKRGRKDEDEKGKKKKEEDNQRGFQGEQKGQHEGKDDKNEKGKKKKGERD